MRDLADRLKAAADQSEERVSAELMREAADEIEHLSGALNWIATLYPEKFESSRVARAALKGLWGRSKGETQ